MEKIKSFLSTWYGVATLGTVVTIILNSTIFSVYLSSSVPQGWDGAGHFVASVEYAEHIFPRAWGWLSQWSGGLPYPQYYPPLFITFFALLYKIFFFIPELVIFHTGIVFAQIGSIWVYALLLKKHNLSVMGQYFGISCYILFICSFFPILGVIGLTINSTLNTAMAPQLFSGICFMLFVVGLLRIKEKKYQLLSIISFSGIVLSNAHFILPAALFFCMSAVSSLFIENKKKRILYIYIVVGLFAVGITMYWALPLMYNYDFLTTYPSFVQPSLGTILKVPLFVGALIVGIFLSIYKKKKEIILYTTFLVLVTIAAAAVHLLSRFGVVAHTQRLLSLFVIFAPLVYAHGYQYVSEKLGAKYKRKAVPLFVFIGTIVLLCVTVPIWSGTNMIGIYRSEKSDSVEEIKTYLAQNPRQGFLSVEHDVLRNEPSSFVFNSLYGLYTRVPVFVLRESSISSPFMTPIRNMFSLEPEGWGFKSYLMFTRTFTQRPIVERVDIALRHHMNSFLVRSLYMRNLLSQDNRIVLEKDFGKWALYRAKKINPQGEVLAHKPILFFGKKSFGYRSIHDYDWSKLQEMLLVANSDYTSIYPNNQHIDTNTEIAGGGALFIAEYTYKDINKAYAAIIAFAETGPVVLVEDQTNALYTKLATYIKSNNTNIVVLPRYPRMSMQVEASDSNAVTKKDAIGKGIVDTLQTMQIKKQDTSVIVEQVSFSNKKTTATLSADPKDFVWVRIAQSYFPTWSTKQGSLYMASPAFTAVYTNKKEIVLDFGTPWYVGVGEMITIITIGGIIFWYRKKTTE